MVREYLELEFRQLKIKFNFDLERFIDDFIFLCFFVGNDFIPNLPSLKIREGAIDALLFIYKNEIINLDYYITEGNGNINLKRAQIILNKLGEVEESFLRSYTNNKIYYENRNKQNAQNGNIAGNNFSKKDIIYEKFKNLKNKKLEKNSKDLNKNKEEISLDLNENESDENKKKDKFEENEIEDINKILEKPTENFKRVFKEYIKENENQKVSNYVDNIRLGESGYKERYYQEKFKTSYSDVELRNLIKKAYIEGICWVFNYYYNGCVSWGWFYPFHYAPFASDLIEISDLDIKFDMGEPFEPVEQLLSVLPPYSSYALPESLRDLMHNSSSEIADFFPKDILLDINGHPFSWMGVNLIPFVDEDRIREVVNRQKKIFTEEENIRNEFGYPLVYYNNKENDSLRLLIGENYRNENFNGKISSPSFRIFCGNLSFYNDSINKEKNYECKLKGLNISIVKDSKIAALKFLNAESKPHFSKLLVGVTIPQKIVLEDNLDLYNKRGFRGDQTIKLVNSILKYQNEIENEFKNSLFDRNFNNSRAVEYNPAELEMIKKKRYRERNENNNNHYNNNNSNYNQNNNQQRFNNYNNNYPQNHNQNKNNNFNNYHQENSNLNINKINTINNNFNKNMNMNMNMNNNMNMNMNNNMNMNMNNNMNLNMNNSYINMNQNQYQINQNLNNQFYHNQSNLMMNNNLNQQQNSDNKSENINNKKNNDYERLKSISDLYQNYKGKKN